MKISAIVLARNEEKIIEKAIKSLSFCDEILLIDDESSDDTAQRAEKAGARILVHSKQNEFSGQRNWAMERAKNEWILFIDADEEVTEKLKNELIALSETSQHTVAYAIPRRDFFWKTELKYGETKKTRTKGIIRLVKKGYGVWTGSVHETFTATDNVGKLNEYINHHSHESISSFIQDVNYYSTIRAIELAKQGRKVSVIELLFVPFGKFIYSYFLLGGVLDGPAGFVYSFVMSLHSFLVRAKLATQTYV